MPKNLLVWCPDAQSKASERLIARWWRQEELSYVEVHLQHQWHFRWHSIFRSGRILGCQHRMTVCCIWSEASAQAVSCSPHLPGDQSERVTFHLQKEKFQGELMFLNWNVRNKIKNCCHVCSSDSFQSNWPLSRTLEELLFSKGCSSQEALPSKRLAFCTRPCLRLLTLVCCSPSSAESAAICC